LNAKESLNVEMRNEKMVGAKEQYSLGCHDFEFFFGLFQGSGQLPKPCIPGGGDVLSHIVLRAVTSCEVIQQTYQTWSSDVGDHQRVIGVAGT
jgi:hypothetical protein